MEERLKLLDSKNSIDDSQDQDQGQTENSMIHSTHQFPQNRHHQVGLQPWPLFSQYMMPKQLPPPHTSSQIHGPSTISSQLPNLFATNSDALLNRLASHQQRQQQRQQYRSATRQHQPNPQVTYSQDAWSQSLKHNEKELSYPSKAREFPESSMHPYHFENTHQMAEYRQQYQQLEHQMHDLREGQPFDQGALLEREMKRYKASASALSGLSGLVQNHEQQLVDQALFDQQMALLNQNLPMQRDSSHLLSPHQQLLQNQQQRFMEWAASRYAASTDISLKSERHKIQGERPLKRKFSPSSFSSGHGLSESAEGTFSDLPSIKRAAPLRGRQNVGSKYRGVSWHKRDRRWLARLWVNCKIKYLGSFLSEERAALAVDDEALASMGPNAHRLNFATEEEREALREKFKQEDLKTNKKSNRTDLRAKQDNLTKKEPLKNTEADTEDLFSSRAKTPETATPIVELTPSILKNDNQEESSYKNPKQQE